MYAIIFFQCHPFNLKGKRTIVHVGQQILSGNVFGSRHVNTVQADTEMIFPQRNVLLYSITTSNTLRLFKEENNKKKKKKSWIIHANLYLLTNLHKFYPQCDQ